MTPPPLHSLVLAGGRSRRMGRDKAELSVDGAPPLRDRTARLLEIVCPPVFLSVAPDDQRSYPLATLPDLAPDRGPLAGLEAAFHHAPDHAWLVVACDLPLLDATTLDALAAGRDPARPATAFASRLGRRAEPLCAIYEPAAAPALAAALAADRRCARRFLESLDPLLLELPHPHALANCNRPEDLAEAAALARHGPCPKSVRVEYHAPLRELATHPTEARVTTAATAAGLWEEAREQHRFPLDLDAVCATVNGEPVPWSTRLRPGDRIGFLGAPDEAGT